MICLRIGHRGDAVIKTVFVVNAGDVEHIPRAAGMQQILGATRIGCRGVQRAITPASCRSAGGTLDGSIIGPPPCFSPLRFFCGRASASRGIIALTAALNNRLIVFTACLLRRSGLLPERLISVSLKLAVGFLLPCG